MNKLFIVLLILGLTFGVALTTGTMSDAKFFGLVENLSTSLSLSANDINITTEVAPEIGNAMNYFISGLLNAFGELTIWVSNFVYSHPEAPYKLLLILLFFSLIAPLLLVFFKLLFIVVILIKDKMQSKKENWRFKKDAKVKNR
jgi:hypothetical protein